MMSLKKKKISNVLIYFLVYFTSVLFFLTIIFVINKGIAFNSISLLLVFVGIIFIIIKTKKELIEFYKKHQTLIRFIQIILIIIGFLLRFSFVFFQNKFFISTVLSDTGVHWFGANQLIKNGSFDKQIGEYEKLYPYLFPYTGSLALTMSLFGPRYISVLLLNTICDIISFFSLYILFYRWKNDKMIGLFAMVLWAINPLQIVFCGLPLAIVIVNTFLILSIAVFYLCFTNENNILKLIFFSFLGGIILSIGNSYRPIFVILLIAFWLYWFVLVLKDKKKTQNAIISCVAIIIGYIALRRVPILLHKRFNPFFHGEKGHIGWSVFVGANYGTKGVWNPKDRDYFFGPVLVDRARWNTDIASSIILKEAFLRYKRMAMHGELIEHFANKITILFGDVGNSIYDLPFAFLFPSRHIYYKLLKDVILIYYYSIVIIIGLSIVKQMDSIELDSSFRLLLIIIVLGLFSASMLVEVMNRYSLPFITIFTILAIDLLSMKKNKEKTQ